MFKNFNFLSSGSWKFWTFTHVSLTISDFFVSIPKEKFFLLHTCRSRIFLKSWGKIVNIFLSISVNICFECSKEPFSEYWVGCRFVWISCQTYKKKNYFPLQDQKVWWHIFLNIFLITGILGKYFTYQIKYEKEKRICQIHMNILRLLTHKRSTYKGCRLWMC